MICWVFPSVTSTNKHMFHHHPISLLTSSFTNHHIHTFLFQLIFHISEKTRSCWIDFVIFFEEKYGFPVCAAASRQSNLKSHSVLCFLQAKWESESETDRRGRKCESDLISNIYSGGYLGPLWSDYTKLRRDDTCGKGDGTTGSWGLLPNHHFLIQWSRQFPFTPRVWIFLYSLVEQRHQNSTQP